MEATIVFFSKPSGQRIEEELRSFSDTQIDRWELTNPNPFRLQKQPIYNLHVYYSEVERSSMEYIFKEGERVRVSLETDDYYDQQGAITKIFLKLRSTEVLLDNGVEVRYPLTAIEPVDQRRRFL